MPVHCPESANLLKDNLQIERNSGKIRYVVLFNLFVMLGELVAGQMYGSLALVAEGWHMGSHVAALSIAWIAYRFVKNERLSSQLSFGPGKLLPLGGFTSAIVLGVIAVMILVEAADRLLHPIAIEFNQAILVASIGLVANVISAKLLHAGEEHSASHATCEHHGHSHAHHVHDHNLRAAFLHIVADAVTSSLAVLALLAGKYFGLVAFDPLIGVVGALVILAWAAQLIRTAGWELVDGVPPSFQLEQLENVLKTEGAEILDCHVWRIAPHALACELVLRVEKPEGSEHYRALLKKMFAIHHLVVEERPKARLS